MNWGGVLVFDAKLWRKKRYLKHKEEERLYRKKYHIEHKEEQNKLHKIWYNSNMKNQNVCPFCKKKIVTKISKYCKNCRGLAMKKENHWNWKGGIRKHCGGYIWKLSENHPFKDKLNCVLEHRLIMEEHLGRYLKLEEVVHHINNIHSDNRIENLKLFESKSKHTQEHNFKGDLFSKKNRRNLKNVI